MYKINEAAAMLGVDKIIIYEKLIHNSLDLEAHTHKTNGITYIHDEGIVVLRQLIYKHNKHLYQEKNLSKGQDALVSEEAASRLHRPQWIIDKSEIDMRVKMFEPPVEQATSPQIVADEIYIEGNRIAKKREPVKDSTSSSTTDFTEATGEIKQLLAEKARLKQSIGDLRSGLITLDSEIKRKDDAVIGYHKLMNEDLEWLWDMESKLLSRLKNGM